MDSNSAKCEAPGMVVPEALDRNALVQSFRENGHSENDIRSDALAAVQS